jgi:hypothetical protein
VSVGPKGEKDPKADRKNVQDKWSHHTEEEATWETENYLNTKYPGFLRSQNREFQLPILISQIESRDEIPFKGGRL